MGKNRVAGALTIQGVKGCIHCTTEYTAVCLLINNVSQQPTGEFYFKISKAFELTDVHCFLTISRIIGETLFSKFSDIHKNVRVLPIWTKMKT